MNLEFGIGTKSISIPIKLFPLLKECFTEDNPSTSEIIKLGDILRRNPNNQRIARRICYSCPSLGRI